jgi:small-conductance mechanosensitive channel
VRRSRRQWAHGGPALSRPASPTTTLAAVWFAVAILACLALLAIADYQRDPEDWKRHRILYVTMVVAVVIVTIVAALIPSGS